MKLNPTSPPSPSSFPVMDSPWYLHGSWRDSGVQLERCLVHARTRLQLVHSYLLVGT